MKRVPLARPSLLAERAPLSGELCGCLPWGAASAPALDERDGCDGQDEDAITPVPALLQQRVYELLARDLRVDEPLSLVFLHIAQLEPARISSQSAMPERRRRYHAPASFLAQILCNVRRAIRIDDQIVTCDDTAAAFCFPGVDQHGAYGIVERIYQSINLLQAETVIPPLQYDTTVVLSVGSYPAPATSIEGLLHDASITARRLTFRPAIVANLWRSESLSTTEEHLAVYAPFGQRQHTPLLGTATSPFMRLPAKLPPRLKHLIPYALALELCCVPVGRNHSCLTVALAEPENRESVLRLRDYTGLTIFPVSCDLAALHALLAEAW